MRPHCPRCKKHSPYKYGHTLGRQRWKCRACAYAFTVPHLRYKPAECLYKAADLYEQGLSSNRIAKRLNLSPTTVLKWVRLLSPSSARIHQKRPRAVYPPEVTAALRECRRHPSVYKTASSKATYSGLPKE
ncbi:IS1/IS1595 family N-terminal zinc-binding domain-containing protein [Vampirovibrio chlorellavorus]|uniref:IS1/IS1595 family N-terminal zinc-binding domain-containing protein n=1 Tax=Vampirovibrio chlorellavorus TaxID=758823 RepID=UPI003FCE3B51